MKAVCGISYVPAFEFFFISITINKYSFSENVVDDVEDDSFKTFMVRLGFGGGHRSEYELWARIGNSNLHN